MYRCTSFFERRQVEVLRIAQDCLVVAMALKPPQAEPELLRSIPCERKAMALSPSTQSFPTSLPASLPRLMQQWQSRPAATQLLSLAQSCCWRTDRCSETTDRGRDREQLSWRARAGPPSFVSISYASSTKITTQTTWEM